MALSLAKRRPNLLIESAIRAFLGGLCAVGRCKGYLTIELSNADRTHLADQRIRKRLLRLLGLGVSLRTGRVLGLSHGR